MFLPENLLVSLSDLSSILSEWPYEPGRINARRIDGADGRQKLQVRLDLGIMQMEIDGRPDGKRHEGFDSLLEYHLDRLKRYTRESSSSSGAGLAEAGFVLSPDECRALREEAVQFYHRYVCLFSLTDYPRVVRDTNRNLAALDLMRDYAAREADRHVLEQIRPQVLMMRTRAEAEAAVANGRPREALAALDRGLRELRDVFDEAGAGEAFQHANEVQLLRGMRDTLIPKLPVSQRVELQERLQAALDAENYELAAILRDELRLLGG